MGLLTLPFRLPLLPVQGVIRLAQLIQEEAERELNDPARIRRELEAIDRARGAGEISGEKAARVEEDAVRPLTGLPEGTARTARGDEG